MPLNYLTGQEAATHVRVINLDLHHADVDFDFLALDVGNAPPDANMVADVRAQRFDGVEPVDHPAVRRRMGGYRLDLQRHRIPARLGW